MSEKDEVNSFIQGIIMDIKKAKEFSETEKDELIAVALEAWEGEQQ